MTALIHLVLAQPMTILTPKWTRNSLGTNWEGGLVIGDVTGDGQEDVVFAGGSQDRVYVLNGIDGSTIATYTNNRIGTYTQPQLYDVDGDGTLDILVPLYYQPGMAAVRYNQVTGNLDEMWEIYSQGTSGSGSVMAKPVAGDIDGDGDLDIFLASQDVSPIGGYDGTIVRIDHLGNILATTFTWRACSGGLSLGDTDNDGVFELYQGDRQMGYSDGGYGKGAKSYWADDLAERWIRLDALTSSQAPVLADVNGDGIKDAIAGMYRVQYVYDSRTGEIIYSWRDNSLSVHYGTTVYDIDGDGHLELLANDGDHDNDPYTDIFDLVTGQMDAQLSMGPGVYDPEEEEYVGGDWKWGPVVADISPSHPGMEIIAAPNGTGLDGGQPWNGAIMIWSSGNGYESIQNVTRTPSNTSPGTYTTTRLGSQLGFPVIQDIDGDGLLELVTHSSYPGNVYAFDTSAPAPGYNEALLPGSKRIRSEVTYYGEARLGVAEHTIMPWEEDYWTAPLVGSISPSDNALAVPVSTNQLSFRLREHQSESLTYSVTTNPDIGSDSGSISSGASYNWNVIDVDVDGLDYDTTYQWTVTADDGSEVTSRTYTFRTELETPVGNIAPTQDNPSLIALDGVGSTTSTFEASAQGTDDVNDNDVTNIYRWTVNGDPVAQLLLPFDTRDETNTQDYSGFNNDGEVIGAAWVPNGRVGGAYSFDGKDDAIIISDGGLGYFNDIDYPNNNEELGGFGNWNGVTVEAWIYLTEYNNGSRIVAKIPSYALGFQSGYTNRIYASVWPYTGEIADDDNQASVDRERSVSANVDIQLNTWYHIAFTYESGVGIRLFFNGQQVAQSSVYEGPLSPSWSEPLYIGRLVQPFAGMIDEVRLYNYAQPAQQIYNRYMESKDGDSSSSLFLPVGFGGPGDTLGCDVIPTDSYAEGSILSNSTILLNSPPVASNLNMYPIRDRAYRLDNEDLGASYDYSDPDGNAESGTQIRWFRNGTLQSDFNDFLEVPAISTSIDQTWYFTVLPRDSFGGVGDLQTSETITIRGNAVPDTGSPTLDSMNGGTDYDDEDLVGTAATTTDGDGDSTTNIFHWIRDGVSMTNLQMPFDTEVPRYLSSNGVTLDYSGYGNNGIVNGSSWIQDGVIGGAFSFDGNDYIRVLESGNRLGGDGGWSEISVEFWIRATGVTSQETVIMLHDADFSTGGYMGAPYGIAYRMDFRAYNNRDRFFWFVSNSTGVGSVEFSDYDNFGEWHHIVGTYESGVGLRLYVDGMERAFVAFSGNINATLDDFLDIGGYGSGSDFVGLLDEVRIYPFALSSAQIFQRYVDTIDGDSDSETIVPQETASGNTWVCEVIPNDSWADGTTRTSTTLNVVSVSGNNRPRIDWYSPADSAPSVNEGFSLDFMQVSSDPDEDDLTYLWTLDSNEQATTQNWTYTPDYASQGTRMVRITVSDGNLTDYQEWTVNVIDVSTEFRNLTILVAANGTTDPMPGTYLYGLSTDASVQAVPNAGYVLDHWLLNGSDVGSSDPYVVTMDANYELQPVFVEGQYTLTVYVVGSGFVVKVPDQPTYSYGDLVELTADPEEGDVFAGWSGDASGTELNIIVNMTDNKEITATFLPLFDLVIVVDGEGSTDPAPGAYEYPQGAGVQVDAIPNPGFKLSYWLLNGANLGDTDPYTVTMDADYVLTAVFVPATLFEDGFESGSFSAWSGSSATSGETATVVGTLPHHGVYNAMFTTNGDGGTERAYVYSNVGGTDVYVRAYFNIQDGLPFDATDNRFNLFSFMGASGTIASFGVRRSGTSDLWYINSMVGLWFASVGPSMDQWYSVEAYVHVDSSEGVLALWIDGILALELTGLNTASVGSAVTSVRGGLVYVNGVAHNVALYGDCFVISTDYIGLESVLVQYELTVVVVGSGTADPAVGTHLYDVDTLVNLTATADVGWVFSEWSGDLTGSVNPTTILMNGNKTVTATFVELPPSSNGYLVVRGADDHVYYRIYNSSSSSWGDWNVVPDGATVDSPAAAVYSGRLYLVVRGMDNASLWFGSVNLTDNSFSGWTLLSGASPSVPTLVNYGSEIVLVVRGFTNMVYYRSYDTVSEVWADWTAVPDGATCDTPSAAVLGTDLHLVVRGFSTTDVSGNNTLWHGTVDLGDDSFSGWTMLPGATPSAPTLAASETLGSLYLTVRGMTDVIWINTWNGTAWEGWTALPEGSTCDSPAVTVMNGELHMVVRCITGTALWHYYINLTTEAHSGWMLMDGWTTSAPTLNS